MTNIRQVIEDLSLDAMCDLLRGPCGYSLPLNNNEYSEYSLRNTIKDEYYKYELLSARDIREMAEDEPSCDPRAFNSWCMICGGPPGKCWYDAPEVAEDA